MCLLMEAGMGAGVLVNVGVCVFVTVFLCLCFNQLMIIHEKLPFWQEKYKDDMSGTGFDHLCSDLIYPYKQYFFAQICNKSAMV
jgi:hypothetical protein